MKKNKKTNKMVIGLVLVIVGIIGIFGSFSEAGFSSDTAMGSVCCIVPGVILIWLEKMAKKNAKKNVTTQPAPQIPRNRNTVEAKPIPDGEKDFDLLPDYANGQFLCYEYEQQICFIKDDTLDERFGHVIGNGGKQLLFQLEPENQYDCMAVALYLDDKKIGYVYSGQTQDMIHDFHRNGWEICAFINKYSKENKTATYKIGFYKPLERLESKQFPLTKTAKKVSEFETRAENLSLCNDGDYAIIEIDDVIEGNYVVLANGYSEIGELPKAAVNFIDEHNPKRIYGILNNIEEDDNGKLKAKITVYLI